MKKTGYIQCILELEYDEEIPKDILTSEFRDLLEEYFTVHMYSVLLDD